MGILERLFKRLNCYHDFRHLRNIYGDELSHQRKMKRSEWKCKNCGKRELRDHLHLE